MRTTILAVPTLASLLLTAPVLALPQTAPAAPAAPATPAKQATPAAPAAPAKSAEGEGDAPAAGGKKQRPAGIWYGMREAPAKAPGAIRIAAYNVENLFDGTDDPTLSGEFDDIKFVTKPTRLKAIADAIRRLDADVLSIEEIESLDALKWFRDNYLKDLGYQYAYSEDVGYYRGVEQAFLSRFPIKGHATFVQEDLSDMEGKRAGDGWAPKKPEQGSKFQRSPLKVEIDAKGTPITLYSVHLKAGGKEFEFQRESEALQTLEFIKEAIAKDPGARVAVMGDFNATPSNKTIKLLGAGGLRGAYDFRGVKKGNTKDLYTTHDSGRTLDYIFMSPGLAADAVDGSFFVLGTVHPSSDYDWKTDPDKEKVPEGYASDHYPVAIDIVPGRGAAAKDAPAKDAPTKDAPAKAAEPGPSPASPSASPSAPVGQPGSPNKR